MSQRILIRFICPVCGAGGANPSGCPIPLCHKCKDKILMKPKQ